MTSSNSLKLLYLSCISLTLRQQDQISQAFGIPGGEPSRIKVLLLGDLCNGHQCTQVEVSLVLGSRKEKHGFNRIGRMGKRDAVGGPYQ